MARYMRSNLEQDIGQVNEAAKRNGLTTYLVVGSRNGYTALDEYRANPNGGQPICIRTLDCNSPPRELLMRAWEWAAN